MSKDRGIYKDDKDGNPIKVGMEGKVRAGVTKATPDKEAAKKKRKARRKARRKCR